MIGLLVSTNVDGPSHRRPAAAWLDSSACRALAARVATCCAKEGDDRLPPLRRRSSARRRREGNLVMAQITRFRLAELARRRPARREEGLRLAAPTISRGREV